MHASAPFGLYVSGTSRGEAASEVSIRPALWSGRDGSRTARRSDFRLRETDHAETADPPLPVLRWQSPLHAERGASRREELSALRDAGRAPRVARETVRSDADPPDEARWPGRDEDRDGRYEGARGEEGREGEEGLAEDRAALEAVAPILPDGGATFAALPAFRGLVRLHHDERGIRELVPPGFADQEEREVVAPGLELEERDLAGREHLVQGLHEVPCIFEPNDPLLVAEPQLRLPQVQFLVEPADIFHLDGEVEGTEAAVDLCEDRRGLKRFRDAEPEPVDQDSGNRAVWRRLVLEDERRLAARIHGDAFRENGFRRRDGEAEVDEARVGLVHGRFGVARLRPRGRGGLQLPHLRLRVPLPGLRFRRRGLFLLLQFLGRFVRLARLRLFFLPEPEGHPAARTRVARNKSLVVKTARRIMGPSTPLSTTDV